MTAQSLLEFVDKRDFRTLFVEELGWDNPDHTDIHHEIDGTTYTLTNVASFKGLRIWHCPHLPTRPIQRQIDVLVGRDTLERLVIFTSEHEQEWRWPRRSQLGAANAKLLAHTYIPGDPNYRTLAQRLEAIELDFDEDITLVTLLDRMRTEFDQEAETASAQAARLMGGLYTQLDNAGVDEHNSTLLLARLLFLLFGDDAAMWKPAGIFASFLREHTTTETLHFDLLELFDVLDTDERSRTLPDDSPLQRFPYVNGGLFADEQTLPALSSSFRDLLLEACTFDWSIISPAIFGGMFQTVKSKEARREAGEHYTSESNILKTIGPLYLDGYRARLDKAKNSKRELTTLHNELATLQYLDPACGCGNFLIVAYREMRALELELLKLRRDLDLVDPALGPTQRAQLTLDVTTELNVRLDQFYGFEISEWPARIAETAMLLVDHLANQQMAEEFGIAPDRLPIKISAQIACSDALNLDWSAALPTAPGKTWVFGNPPFLGHATRTEYQAEQLRRAWGTDDISRLDFVTGWHAKTLHLLANRSGAFAYVTTNSITQGDQVPRLFGTLADAGWRIGFAHRTFAWDSQAPGKAAVHCVIVGFTTTEEKPRLFSYTRPHAEPHETAVTEGINAYLVDAPWVLVDKRSSPLSPEITPAVFGNMARDDGNLIVEADEHHAVVADPVAAKYLRRFIGSRELLHNQPRWCLWLTDLDPSDLARSPLLKSRVDAVAKFRARSKAASTQAMAATPHLFGQRSHRDVAHLAIPSVVSETRRFFTAKLVSSETIVSNSAFTVEDPTGLQFALLSSSMFITWQKTIGGRLKSDPRFSNTLTWNTFPVPPLEYKTREAIIAAGRKVLAARERHAERSLSDAYNPLTMDPALVKAHDDLDFVVDEAMGAIQGRSSDKRRLEVLFARYAELTARHA